MKFEEGDIYEIVLSKEDIRAVCIYEGRETYPMLINYHAFKTLYAEDKTNYFYFTDDYLAQAGVSIKKLKKWEIVLEFLNDNRDNDFTVFWGDEYERRL